MPLKRKKRGTNLNDLLFGSLRVYSEMQGHIHGCIIPGQTSRPDLTLTQTSKTRAALIHGAPAGEVETPLEGRERREDSLWEPLSMG